MPLEWILTSNCRKVTVHVLMGSLSHTVLFGVPIEEVCLVKDMLILIDSSDLINFSWAHQVDYLFSILCLRWLWGFLCQTNSVLFSMYLFTVWEYQQIYWLRQRYSSGPFSQNDPIKSLRLSFNARPRSNWLWPSCMVIYPVLHAWNFICYEQETCARYLPKGLWD